tara:strand:- start:20874 stop:21065 length:192 start_codon:yes stop_codon:yes gene_type:complete
MKITGKGSSFDFGDQHAFDSVTAEDKMKLIDALMADMGIEKKPQPKVSRAWQDAQPIKRDNAS